MAPNSSTRPAAGNAAGNSVAQRAKLALRRLALDKLEPTPENYAIAYRLESGGGRPPAVPAEALALVQGLVVRLVGADGDERGRDVCKAMAAGQWGRAEALLNRVEEAGPRLAALIDRLVRGVERGGRQWTSARKKENLQRVLDANRGDPARLQLRLGQMLTRWDADAPDAPVEIECESHGKTVAANDGAASLPAKAADGAVPGLAGLPALVGSASTAATANQDWSRLTRHLVETVQQALPQSDAAGRRLISALAGTAARVHDEGATDALVGELVTHCEASSRVIKHRHHLVEMLGKLCHELTASLSELAEDQSWAKGQSEAMRITLEDGITARGVKSVTELLRKTRGRQVQMRAERERARDALKSLINKMLSELGDLGLQTGRFHESVGRYADVIEDAESLDSLTGVMREIVEESRTVQSLVAQTQQRLHDEHAKATDLTLRVSKLEDELHRLSNEVTTDQLTQVANRRGLLSAFERECRQMQRTGGSLSMALLDIDNFKRLNDELGHNAGDEALKSLASSISKSLRPADTVARYGGEEFVVLLPDTPVDDAQAVLTRLQRSLSGGLFMHEQKNVMVTFSAGVTTYRDGERIEEALERADQALFEAKRTGKNRTCAS
ncbi:MAG: GGDEF domain-containing protein [Rhizobacter sp.]|nr:GGDEF domain-containing protein [Rhizobacter sp.]